MHWIKIKKLIFLWSHYCHVRAWQSFLWALGRKGHVCLDHGILSQGRTTSYRTDPFSNPAHIYNFYIWIAILQINAKTWHRWAMLETTQRYFCWFQEHKPSNWASYMAYIITYGKAGNYMDPGGKDCLAQQASQTLCLRSSVQLHLYLLWRVLVCDLVCLKI